MKVETLPDGGNPRVIGALTLTDARSLRIDRQGEASYLVRADERSFHIVHRARQNPYLIMRHYYGRRYRGQEEAVMQYVVRRQPEVVFKRLDKHAYGLRVGAEWFVFQNPREHGPPVELVDRLPQE